MRHAKSYRVLRVILVENGGGGESEKLCALDCRATSQPILGCPSRRTLRSRPLVCGRRRRAGCFHRTCTKTEIERRWEPDQVSFAQGHGAAGHYARPCGPVGWARLTHGERPCLLPQALGERASSMGIYISSRDRGEITQGFSDSEVIFWAASKKCGVFWLVVKLHLRCKARGQSRVGTG